MYFWGEEYMERYRNIARNSGIIAYETGKTFIRIKFKDGIYTYNYVKPGKAAVEQMKLLAERGKGLSTYISRFVKDNFAQKTLI
jgi:hypothetical protein